MRPTHPGPDLGAAFEVEPSAVASFRERGFALIPRLAEPDEVVRLARSSTCVRRAHRPHGRRPLRPRQRRRRRGRLRAADDHGPLHYEPELRRVACRDRALRIAQTLLGPSATCRSST